MNEAEPRAVLYAIDAGEPDLLCFNCPGCGMSHAIRVRRSDGRRPSWEWNGSVVAPTFSPSIMVRWERRGQPKVCHSFVRDGVIEFLADCTHALAGKTVPLKPDDAVDA